MSYSSYYLLDMLISFGGVIAFCVWQLRGLQKLRESRERREGQDDKR
jgi:hypothetical protein